MDDHIPVGTGFDRLAAQDPDAVALYAPDGVVTRAELAAASSRAAREFAALGAGQDDLVTIGLANGAGFLRRGIGRVEARSGAAAGVGQAARRRAGRARGDRGPTAGRRPGGGRPALAAPDLDPDPTLSPDPLPPALPPSWKAPTSGGSTGRPKIIVAGQAGWLDWVTQRAERLGIGGPGDVFAVTAPLYHNAPFMFSLIALLRGCPLLVLDRFDGVHVLDAVVAHRVHWLYAVMGRILRLPDSVRSAADLSSVQTRLHVGAPCPEPVKRAWIDWVGPEKVLELYAGTESLAVCQIDGVEWLAHPRSVGRPVSGEIRIADAGGHPLPVGEVGEVWMRPPPDTVSTRPGPPPSALPSPAMTYHYLGAESRFVEGWESIGDLGHMDADGYLFLADRRSDLILVGGSNVYPAEVEAALSEHPHVLSSCVIGLPDDDLGARVHAIVQLAAEVPDADLRVHVATRLTRNKGAQHLGASGSAVAR